MVISKFYLYDIDLRQYSSGLLFSSTYLFTVSKCIVTCDDGPDSRNRTYISVFSPLRKYCGPPSPFFGGNQLPISSSHTPTFGFFWRRRNVRVTPYRDFKSSFLYRSVTCLQTPHTRKETHLLHGVLFLYDCKYPLPLAEATYKSSTFLFMNF